MTDPFLIIVRVDDEQGAMRDSLNSALQRSRTYARLEINGERKKFRTEWARLIREEAKRYVRPEEMPSGDEHCTIIRRIAKKLSDDFGPILNDGKLRFGVSQKAFNLYLKDMWRLDLLHNPQSSRPKPPHCPVDRLILNEVKILDAWTKCDSEQVYMGWIGRLLQKAGSRHLSDWEYDVWLKNR
jgi:hypothetical protein